MSNKNTPGEPLNSLTIRSDTPLVMRTLRRGFLRKHNGILRKNRLGPAILLAFGTAFGLYGVVWFCWEGIRFNHDAVTYFIITLPEETSLHFRWFFALSCSVTGWGVAMKFLFESSIWPGNGYRKIYQLAGLNDQTSFLIYTLFFASKVVSLTVIFIIATQYSLYFVDLDMVYWTMALIPFVLFMHQWLTLLRLWGRKTYGWMGIATAGILANSFWLSTLFYEKSRQIEENTINNYLYNRLNIEVPVSDHISHPVRRSQLAAEVYLVWDEEKQRTSVYNEWGQPLAPGSLQHYIKEMEKGLRYSEPNKYLNIIADYKVPYHEIHQLKEATREANFYNILYATKNSAVTSPGNRIVLTYTGITEKLRLSPTHPLYNSDPYMLYDYLKLYNRIRITTDASGTFFINGMETTDEQVFNRILHYSERYKYAFVVMLQPDMNMQYGRYIELLDLMHTAVKLNQQAFEQQLKNKPSLQKYRDRIPDIAEKVIPLFYIDVWQEPELIERYSAGP